MESAPPPEAAPAAASDCTVTVLFESEEYAIINKPPDVWLDGDHDNTVEKQIRALYPDRPKPHFVHQLDYATSGVLCLAFSRRSTAAAAALFQSRSTVKVYSAILEGHVDVTRFPEPSAPTPSAAPAPAAEIPKPVLAPTHYRLVVLSARQALASSGGDLSLLPPQHLNCIRWPVFTLVQRVAAAAPGDPCPAYTPAAPGKKRWGKPVEVEPAVVWDTGPLTPEHVRWAVEAIEAAVAAEAADVSRYREQCRAVAVASVTEEQHVYKGASGVLEIRYPIASLGKSEFRMSLGDASNPGDVAHTTLTVRRLGKFKGHPVTLVSLSLHTGRRHQLRLHCAGIGHPIVGDCTYGSGMTSATADRMMLNAESLTLPFHASSSCGLHEPLTVTTGNVLECYLDAGVGGE